jgi:DNA-binding response OmpR family regulator
LQWEDSAIVSPGRAAKTALILVVERDEHVRELESYFLREAGFDVEFASNGEAALELARTKRFDLIITEILVPGVDGLALCRSVKKDPQLKGASILIFSILSAGVRAHEAGADAFLRKPLAERSLLDTVKNLLATRETSV